MNMVFKFVWWEEVDDISKDGIEYTYSNEGYQKYNLKKAEKRHVTYYRREDDRKNIRH